MTYFCVISKLNLYIRASVKRSCLDVKYSVKKHFKVAFHVFSVFEILVNLNSFSARALTSSYKHIRTVDEKDQRSIGIDGSRWAGSIYADNNRLARTLNRACLRAPTFLFQAWRYHEELMTTFIGEKSCKFFHKKR